jgi:hypothetical protein
MKTMKSTSIFALTVLMLVCSPVLPPAHALIFFGEDINTSYTGGAVDDSVPLVVRPNSDAASNSFQSQLTGVSTENFEGFTNGATPTVLTFGPDLASLTGNPSILEVAAGTTFNGIYPTSGTKTLFQVLQSSFDISFSSPQAAFGFYATDIGELASLQLNFDSVSGPDVLIPVPHTLNPNNTGSVLFFGYIDAQNPFNKVTFINTNPGSNDGFGYDDLTIGRAENVVDTTVPEPGTLALFVLGGIGTAVTRQKKRGLSI